MWCFDLNFGINTYAVQREPREIISPPLELIQFKIKEGDLIEGEEGDVKSFKSKKKASTSVATRKST